MDLESLLFFYATVLSSLPPTPLSFRPLRTAGFQDYYNGQSSVRQKEKPWEYAPSLLLVLLVELGEGAKWREGGRECRGTRLQQRQQC